MMAARKADSPDEPALESLVLVYGHPGVGKSTLASTLADTLRWPLLAKDVIKEATWESVPRPPNIGVLSWSRMLGGAAYEAMFRVARDSGPRLVLEAPLSRTEHGAKILALTARPIELFLYATPEILLERLHNRRPTQHSCHLAYPPPTIEALRVSVNNAVPLSLGGPLLELNLTEHCDVDAVAKWVDDAVMVIGN